MTRSDTSRAPGSTFRLRCVRGRLAKRSFTFRGRAVVGRSAGLDLCIDCPSVSRRHAQMEFVGGSVFVLDLSSANGTRINRKLIEGLTQLRPGDRLQFGADDSVFQLWGPARPPMRRAVPLACAAMVLAIPVAWAAISRAVSRAPVLASAEGNGLPASQTPTLPKCGVPSSGGFAASEGTVADQGCASLPSKEVGAAVPSTREIEPLRPDPIERPPSDRAEARAARN